MIAVKKERVELDWRAFSSKLFSEHTSGSQKLFGFTGLTFIKMVQWRKFFWLRRRTKRFLVLRSIWNTSSYSIFPHFDRFKRTPFATTRGFSIVSELMVLWGVWTPLAAIRKTILFEYIFHELSFSWQFACPTHPYHHWIESVRYGIPTVLIKRSIEMCRSSVIAKSAFSWLPA